MLQIIEKKEGLIFKIAVQPRASRNQVAGLRGDGLKIKLTAPPVDGAANKACLQLLAKNLGLPKSALAIHSGANSRTKRILLRLAPDAARTAEQLRAKLLELAAT
jgi:uncharacterized protein (TIGR00251 family)